MGMQNYEEDSKNNLCKLWNRSTLGSYFPSAVKRVMIPKGNVESRLLGIPAINDRISPNGNKTLHTYRG